MLLTLQQAATQLGKSLRQVRYMVKLGRLAARKIGATWHVESDNLKPSPGQIEAAAAKDQKLRAAIEDALDGDDRADGKERRRRYSMRDLRAVQVALPIQRACEAELGPTHASTHALTSVLEHLARGCHRFARADKIDAYRAARDEASRCACALVIVGTENAVNQLDRIEQDLMPAIAGLLRRHEQRARP